MIVADAASAHDFGGSNPPWSVFPPAASLHQELNKELESQCRLAVARTPETLRRRAKRRLVAKAIRKLRRPAARPRTVAVERLDPGVESPVGSESTGIQSLFACPARIHALFGNCEMCMSALVTMLWSFSGPDRLPLLLKSVAERLVQAGRRLPGTGLLHFSH